MSEPSADHLIELRGMRKEYPGCLANDDVDMIIRRGEIHALLGENGAGKSTLVKMIYGVLKPDAGTILFNDEQVNIVNPAKARELGVAMVFQHFSLFDSLTVVENIALGIGRKTGLDSLAQEITVLSERYGLPLDPNRHVYSLSVGERQRIEIIRCLLQKPKLLVMDEPTSVLTPQEVDKLFETLQRLCEEGMSILYISHKLDEIKAICHRATVLRDGRRVDCVDVADQSAKSMAALMMGEELKAPSKREIAVLGEQRLIMNKLSLSAADELGISLQNISLSVHGGEIVGIAGVAGNGQDELLQAINGEQLNQAADSVLLDGNQAGDLGPNQRRLLGLASVPEKRLGHGAVPSMSLLDNTLLTAFKRLGLINNQGWINHAKNKQCTADIIREHGVKTTGLSAAASSLSGGNLQKYIVGRELIQNPEVLVVSQPTWGVDAGAAQRIREALKDLAKSGAAVLVISQDLDELIEISDRIGAICAGRLSEFYPVQDVSYEQMGLLMAGAALETAE
ncbi:MAG: ABC-type uncharacterized transport system ATPase subunit [Gammaproteobacteria bacterium]|jgi:ABC-type uncharacterized transport system ATPase subunit